MPKMNFPGLSENVDYRRKSNVLNASGQAINNKSIFYGFMISTDGINDVTLKFYDGDSNSTDNLIPDIKIRGDVGIFVINFETGILARNGVYVDITIAGSGSCGLQLYYDN